MLTLKKFHKSRTIDFTTLTLVATVCTLFANASLLIQGNHQLPNDWGYFNSLSLVVRSAVWKYGALPIHNPWVCGGLDIFANPQSRVWSPFFIADLILSPQFANIFSLLAYGVLGFIGTYYLLTELGSSAVASLLGSVMFISSNWFALHFFEGHIPFGSMQLLPTVVFLITKIERPLAIVAGALMIGMIILDGGIYAVIFSFFLVVTFIGLFAQYRRKLISSIKSQKSYWLTSCFASILITLPKTLPVLLAAAARTPILDFNSMTGPDLTQALLNPILSIFDYLPSRQSPYRFHEFGCYLSVLGIAVIFFACIKIPGFIRQNFPAVAGFILWLWIGSGWIATINPWRIFHYLPLLNNAHVQSRVFIIMYFFFIILVTKSVGALVKSYKTTMFLLPILVVEAILIRNIPALSKTRNIQLPGIFELIESKTILRTVPFAFQPDHYLKNSNSGSSSCYEPSFEPKWVYDSSNPKYRGEIWTYPFGVGSAALTKVIPGRIEFQYNNIDKGYVIFNANALFNWDVEQGEGQVIGTRNELLVFKPSNPGSGEVSLVYRPVYLNTVVASFIFGLIIYAFLILRARSHNDSKK